MYTLNNCHFYPASFIGKYGTGLQKNSRLEKVSIFNIRLFLKKKDIQKNKNELNNLVSDFFNSDKNNTIKAESLFSNKIVFKKTEDNIKVRDIEKDFFNIIESLRKYSISIKEDFIYLNYLPNFTQKNIAYTILPTLCFLALQKARNPQFLYHYFLEYCKHNNIKQKNEEIDVESICKKDFLTKYNNYYEAEYNRVKNLLINHKTEIIFLNTSNYLKNPLFLSTLGIINLQHSGISMDVILKNFGIILGENEVNFLKEVMIIVLGPNTCLAYFSHLYCNTINKILREHLILQLIQTINGIQMINSPDYFIIDGRTEYNKKISLNFISNQMYLMKKNIKQLRKYNYQYYNQFKDFIDMK